MRTLYMECATGISGDMIAASLLDLGADRGVLEKALAGIPSDGYEVRIGRVKRSGIDCCDFDVILDREHDGRDHDMEYLYEHLRGDGISAQDHSSAHDHTHHHHHHTGMREICGILKSLEMTESARELALKIFRILAEAEAKAHGTDIDEVHFHEVGAIDSIIDIVAAAVCFDDLDIDEVVFTSITEGSGSVRCQHGVLPVPVPAVAGIAQAYGLPLRITQRTGELVTPTGAAFAAAVMTKTELPREYTISRIGLGAGKREYTIPSILRAMLLEVPEEPRADTAGNDTSDVIYKLECDVDDCTGEQLGYAMERLMDSGAREAHFGPVYMKKGRPGWEITVICDEDHIGGMEDILFEETTTIGIRRQRMERSILTRRMVKAQTAYGEIAVKISGEGRRERVHPEYGSVAEAARRCGVPFGTVYDAAMEAMRETERG